MTTVSIIGTSGRAGNINVELYNLLKILRFLINHVKYQNPWILVFYIIK